MEATQKSRQRQWCEIHVNSIYRRGKRHAATWFYTSTFRLPCKRTISVIRSHTQKKVKFSVPITPKWNIYRAVEILSKHRQQHRVLSISNWKVSFLRTPVMDRWLHRFGRAHIIKTTTKIEIFQLYPFKFSILTVYGTGRYHLLNCFLKGRSEALERSIHVYTSIPEVPLYAPVQTFTCGQVRVQYPFVRCHWFLIPEWKGSRQKQPSTMHEHPARVVHPARSL